MSNDKSKGFIVQLDECRYFSGRGPDGRVEIKW